MRKRVKELMSPSTEGRICAALGVLYEKFTENYNAGEVIHIKLAPEWFEFIETPNKTLETNETNSINTIRKGVFISTPPLQ